MVPWAYPSQHPEWHHDRFSRISRAHGRNRQYRQTTLYAVCSTAASRLYHVGLCGTDAIFQSLRWHPLDWKPGGAAVEAVVVERKERGRERTVAEPQCQRVIDTVHKYTARAQQLLGWPTVA